MPRGRVAAEHPTTRTIRIDNEVYEWLQSKAVPFKDGPNTVLHRLMDEEKERKKMERCNNGRELR